MKFPDINTCSPTLSIGIPEYYVKEMYLHLPTPSRPHAELTPPNVYH